MTRWIPRAERLRLRRLEEERRKLDERENATLVYKRGDCQDPGCACRAALKADASKDDGARFRIDGAPATRGQVMELVRGALEALDRRIDALMAKRAAAAARKAPALVRELVDAELGRLQGWRLRNGHSPPPP